MRRQHTAGLWEPCLCLPMAHETHPSEHTPADGGDGASRMEPAAPAMPALSHGHCSEPLLLGLGPRFSSWPYSSHCKEELSVDSTCQQSVHTTWFLKGKTQWHAAAMCYLGSGATGAACWAARDVLISTTLPCSQWNLMVLSQHCVLARCSFLLASGTAILSSHTLRCSH